MNKRGIALMMVISAIMLISMIVLEFVYGTTVNYRIAVNEKERLQAYYMGLSSLNLMKVELKMDKQFKSLISSSPMAQNIPLDLSQPLCQQFPFSTALIRAFFIGGEVPLMGGGKGQEKNEEGEAKESESKDVQGTMFQREAAEDFLSFNGDFDGSCANEESKINFNFFATLDPAQAALSGANSYDTYKTMLVDFLKQNKFKKLFSKPEDIDEIVKNIADWVDKNDVRNELNNVSQGAEEAIYKERNAPRPKNAKFLSLDELHLVEGVDDTWFLPLEDMFTVYGDSKINICQASDDVKWAVIVSYVGQIQNLPAINMQDPEVKKKLLDSIQFSCTGTSPQTGRIAQDLNTVLGATGGGPSFSDMISTESRYYSLKLTGQVGDTVVNIKTVLDTKDADPKKWKMLYYKVY